MLLLDEPTANLDLSHQSVVLDEARRQARAGRAVLAILHDLNLAAAYRRRDRADEPRRASRREGAPRT